MKSGSVYFVKVGSDLTFDFEEGDRAVLVPKSTSVSSNNTLCEELGRLHLALLRESVYNVNFLGLNDK